MIVLDVEATGTDYAKHSIVSLGALDISNPSNRIYEECRIWDGAHIEDDAMRVNGFTREQVVDPKKQMEAELVRRFLDWSGTVEERTFAGQNVSFDRDFLRTAAARAGHTNWPFAHRTIDVHSLCYMHMVTRGIQPPVDVQKKHSALNLDKIMKYCGLPEEPQPHNAMTGALSHAEVIARLLYDRKLLPEFEAYPIPWVR